jgi:hypothetical protein
MSKFRLSRRAVLRGAGGLAVALPWLEIMAPERAAHAKAPPARHLVTVFTPGGTVLDNWRPATLTAEDNFELGRILKPLAPYQQRLLGFSGLELAVWNALGGEQSQSGIVGWLTGMAQPGPGKYPTGPSIDQVLAPLLSKDLERSSLQLAVRWGTGKSHGLPHPINIAHYADDGLATPIVPQLDPQEVWYALFGTAPQPQGDAWDKSMLDAVAERYSRLLTRVGKADRERLERHLSKVRELEKSLAALPQCAAPERVDTSGYDPKSGLDSSDDGSTVDEMTDAAIPKVGRFMTDMLVMALACRITAVASLQWCDTEAKHTYPWLGLSQHLRFYMNDGGYHPEECTQIFTWYAEQHAYLIDQLQQTQTASGSLLDDTIVFIGSNLQNPANYAKTDMPYLLAGNGGGLRTGRWLQKDREPHNNLLVSLFNLLGDDRQTFGMPEFCTGPMAGLS